MSTTPLALPSLVGKSIRWSIILSLLMILAGIFAIALPPAAGLAVTIVVGWLLVFSSAMHFVFAWHTRHTGAMLWEILIGAVYLLVGGYTLAHPLLGMVS